MMRANGTSAAPYGRSLFLLAVLVYGIAAWNSTGYHSADEHHQIIEFAQHYLGDLTERQLAWEYPTGIRSSLQVWIAAGAISGSRALGWSDPFTAMFLLRALTAILALLAVRSFIRATTHELPAGLRTGYTALSYFLWYLPFLYVRFSSEAWSGILFLLALAGMLRPERSARWPFFSGVLLAAAVVCRPAVVPMVAGVIGWLIMVRREKLHTLVKVLLGGALMAVLAWALDTVFYGELTFGPWHYYHMVITGPPREAFDTLPWYYYAPWVVKYAIPPLGMALLLALATLCFRRPAHVLAWVIVPTLIALSVLPHKELRFLFLLAPLSPLLLTIGLLEWRTFTGSIPPWTWKTVGMLVLAMNLLGLAVVSTQPAGNGKTALVDHIGPEDRITYLIDPTVVWRIALPPYYRPNALGDTIMDPAIMNDAVSTELLVAVPEQEQRLVERSGQRFIPLASTEPAWVTALLKAYTWNEAAPAWTLYRVVPAETR